MEHYSFGYKTVSAEEKTEQVQGVFDSVAQHYDVMNDLMSLGLHRLWKRAAVDLLQLRPGMKVLDIAAGTGDLSYLISQKIESTGKVILADLNFNMLQHGREKLMDKGIVENTDYVRANAESLPFPNHHFDRLIIGFGLRNVTRIHQALKEMYRVLKPGGCLVILEFSKPLFETLNKAYDVYSFSILPKLGEWIAKDAASYQYLAESIRKHPDQQTLAQYCNNAGFEKVDYYNLAAGIVAMHRGWKF